MKILVTGGAGFIGTNLIKRLVDEGHKVLSLDDYSTGTKGNHIQGVTYWKGDIETIEFLEVKYSLALSRRTANKSISPKKNLTQNSPTSIKYKPLLIRVTSIAPNIVPKTVTLPPDNRVPPITGARKAGSNQSNPKWPAIDGIAAPILAVNIIPASAAKKPDNIWQ